MGISSHLKEFAGKPVIDWERDQAPYDFAKYHYRLWLDYDEAEKQKMHWQDKFARMLDQPNVAALSGLVVGMWHYWGAVGVEEESSQRVVETLVNAAARLPNLKAIFLGDLTYEEIEISWIVQSEIAPLLVAYPNLEVLRVRGSTALGFGKIRHAHLKHLAIECGGLPQALLQEVIDADLPALEHLELWLGEPGYGWNGTIGDIESLVKAQQFPHLKYLGLCDAEIQDQVVAVALKAPLLPQLEVLDFSRGTLSDAGGQTLLEAVDRLKHLKKIDLSHHYLSDDMLEKLKHTGLPFDLSDQNRPEIWDGEEHRYIAVSE